MPNQTDQSTQIEINLHAIIPCHIPIENQSIVTQAITESIAHAISKVILQVTGDKIETAAILGSVQFAYMTQDMQEVAQRFQDMMEHLQSEREESPPAEEWPDRIDDTAI